MSTAPYTASRPAPGTPAAAIRIAGLRVRHRRTVALDSVDLDFGTGVHGLLGPNGAGKTSLIRVLATVAEPAGGRVEILGHDIGDHRRRGEVRRHLGYLPQDFGYYPGFTVREFVAYVAWLKEMPADRVPAAVERAVARVGLADRIDAKVRGLSGGMVRRVGIAQAVVNDPQVLLLDEPTAGLDPEQRVEFRELLRELGTSSTVVVSTHLVEDVAAACTEVTLVDAGRVAYRGTPASLAALGESAGGPGDHPIERGYTAALRAHRAPDERTEPTARTEPTTRTDRPSASGGTTR